MWLSAARVITAGRKRPARRLRPVAAILAALAPLLLSTGCDPFSSQSNDPVLTVAAVPGINDANLYLAQHDGYFSKEHIKVRIQRYRSVSDEIAALSNGNVDVIAADYGDMFNAVAVSKQPNHPVFKILADGYDAAAGVTEIVTMPDSSVNQPTKLAGLTIPAPDSQQISVPVGDPTTLAVASTVSVLQSDGVNLAATQWKPMTQQQEITRLTTGQAQAVLVSGVGVYDAQKAGAVELLDGASGPTSGIPLDGFFASSGWLSEPKNATAALDFQHAIYNADAGATMPGPIQAILPAWTGVSKQEADLVTTGTYPLSTITSNIQRTADLMDNEGMTTIEVNVANMVFR
ncbi:MAG TPA: ABC transporter substrate-binding protein [Streptosporangiaceae bacterium]|nr:ABC transporter substrate-binding protein [Streptosporangiaceae bacterium]